jgi:hypothetical protein
MRHSGCPHVLPVSPISFFSSFFSSRSLVPLLPKFLWLFAQDGGSKGEGEGGQTMGEERWDIPSHSTALNSVDVDHGMSI